MDFAFFLKTFLLTALAVLLLQIQINKKTVEHHIHDVMENSVAAGFIGNAAHGGALMIKDTAHRITTTIRNNIGIKQKKEKAETRASRFRWGWDKDQDKDADVD